jgi:hypothetical protein
MRNENASDIADTMCGIVLEYLESNDLSHARHWVRERAVESPSVSKLARMRFSTAVVAIAASLASLAAAAHASLAPAESPKPSPPPPPISIEMCSAEQQSSTNPNLKVGVAFRNLTNSDAVDVKFDLLLLDPSGAIVDTKVESIDGKFAPNELIQPRRDTIGRALLTQPEYPDSSAWNVPNHFGSGVDHVRCQLHSATFADGTSWDPSP